MSEAQLPTTFFSRTYDEALALTIEARDYIDRVQPGDRYSLALIDRLLLNQESQRLTARLTSIMGWLLTQKAIHAGEIARGETARADAALSDRVVCFGQEGEQNSDLPAQFRALLGRSRRLLVRVARLDDMVRRQLD